MNEFEQTIQNMIEYDGPLYKDRQWLLSTFDTWHENPFYEGEPQRHPEDEPYDDANTVDCWFCGELFPDKECSNADEFNNNNGGSVCRDCRDMMT